MIYDKREDFGFSIVNLPWLRVMLLVSHRLVFSFVIWLDVLGVVQAFLVFHSKNLQIISNLLTQCYRYHKLRKLFGKLFRSYFELLSKFGEMSFQEYVFDGISHPVFYSDLVYKLRCVKCKANFVSSGSKKVKRLRRRNYDPVIIERTIGLVLSPSTALYISFLKHCIRTNKAVGTIWRDFLKEDNTLMLVPSDCFSGLLKAGPLW